MGDKQAKKAKKRPAAAQETQLDPRQHQHMQSATAEALQPSTSQPELQKRQRGGDSGLHQTPATRKEAKHTNGALVGPSERQKVPVVGVFQGSAAKGSRKQKDKAVARGAQVSDFLHPASFGFQCRYAF